MKAVILLALFALCKADYPAAVPEIVAPEDSYGPPPEFPADSYAAPAAPSSSYGAPVKAPADSYAAPADSYGAPVKAPADSYAAPAAPSSSYGAPVKAPADSYAPPTKSAPIKIEPLPLPEVAAAPEPIVAEPLPALTSHSASFSFLSDLAAPVTLQTAVKAAPVISTVETVNVPAPQEFQLNIPSLVPPITSLPLPPIVPPVNVLPPVFPPTQVPVPVPVPVQPVPVNPIPLEAAPAAAPAVSVTKVTTTQVQPQTLTLPAVAAPAPVTAHTFSVPAVAAPAPVTAHTFSVPAVAAPAPVATQTFSVPAPASVAHVTEISQPQTVTVQSIPTPRVQFFVPTAQYNYAPFFFHSLPSTTFPKSFSSQPATPLLGAAPVKSAPAPRAPATTYGLPAFQKK